MAFDVEAVSVRRLIAELDGRFPGLGAYIDSRMAIAVDGEIHQDAGAVPLTPGSEVYLIPKIGGG
jgi:molybdopterin converting factor small subunit